MPHDRSILSRLTKPADVPTLRHEVHGTLIVGEHCLRHMYEILRKFVSPESSKEARITFTVLQGDEAPAVFTTPAEVLALRNPRSTPIHTILLSSIGSDREAHLYFSDSGVHKRLASSFTASAPTAEPLDPVFREVRKEIKNIRPFYWPIRFAIDRVVNTIAEIPAGLVVGILSALALVYLTVFLIVVGIQTVQSIRNESKRPTPSSLRDPSSNADSAKQRVPSEPNEVITPVPQETPAMTTREIMVVILDGVLIVTAIIAALFLPAIFRRLCPRVIFKIGEGVERHQNVVFYQRLVIFTIILSSIVIPFGREWVLSRFR